MATFQVKPSNLKNQVKKIESISKTIDKNITSLESIKNNIYLHSDSMQELKKKMNTLIIDFQKEKGYIDSYGKLLEQIATKYNNAENEIINSGKSKNDQNILGAKGNTGYDNQKEKGAWKEGSLTKEGSFLGKDTKGTIEGDIFGYSEKKKFTTGIKWKQDETSGNMKLDSIDLINASKTKEGHGLQGKISGNVGDLSGESIVTIGSIAGTGGIALTLWKNGKLSPQVSGELKLEGKGIDGNISGKYGNDEYNIHGKGNGTLLDGSGKISGGVGKVNYKNKSGHEISGYGVAGEAKLEGYLATGSLEGGLNICGIKVDASVSGKAGGAGIGAGGGVSTGGIAGTITAGAGLGLGLDVNVDWTGFQNPFRHKNSGGGGAW